MIFVICVTKSYPKSVSLTTVEPIDDIRGYQQLLNCDFAIMTICCLLVLIVFKFVVFLPVSIITTKLQKIL
jgi:hypothetical protein